MNGALSDQAEEAIGCVVGGAHLEEVRSSCATT